MRSDLESNRTRDINIISGKLGTRRQKAQGDIVLNELLPNSCIDPNGADRIVTLPPFEAGLFFLITNIGTANTLTVKDSNAVTIEILSPGEGQWFYSDGYKWYREGIDPGSIIGVFGPAGPSHSTGLVPDPGPVAGLDRALFDDGTWKTITASGAVDAYKQITDGTNTAVAQGLTQFKLRSSSGAVTIAVTENDATHGDNANFGINAASIPITGLGGYVANEHINHSTVVLTAGSGLSGGGDITASRTFNLDLNDLIVDTPVPADSIAFFDASGGDTNKSTITSLAGAVDHNALLNWVANKHIDHSLVSITAGTGLSGGGDITTSRVLSLDINGLTLDTIGAGDFIPFYDTSGADTNKSAVTGTGPVALQTSPQFNVDIRPLSNDAASLGLSGTAWSDVFLANGAIVNFNAGALLLTHSTGFLTLSGGALKVPDDAYSAAWDGNFEVPTKNALYDKISTLGAGGGIPEAPTDGQSYSRRGSDASWQVATGGGASPSNTTPSMDGTGAAGSSALYSRGDHVHPSDTSRQPLDAELTAIAGLVSAADQVPYFTGSGTASLMTVTAAARTVLDDTTVAAMLTTLGGQPSDAELTAIAALVSAADQVPYFTGSGTASLMTVTATARTVLDDTSVAAMLTTLGGQPTDADLTAVAALSGTGIARRTAVTPTWTVGDLVTNAELATMAAYSFKGNNSGSTASPGDVTIPGLTAKATPAGTDLILISDQAASGAWKKVAISDLPSSGGATAATAAEYLSNANNTKFVSPNTAWNAAAPVANVTAASFTPDMSAGVDFIWTLNSVTGTIVNPTSPKPGQKGIIFITQDGTGNRLITTWGSQYKFAGAVKPVLSTTANAIDMLSYTVKSATEIMCSFQAGMS